MAQRAPILRRLNVSILDQASVQANTLPSGHVAGAVAAALGLWPVAPAAGLVLLVLAVAIAIAAVVGRYHYVVDCVAGASVALVVWSLM
jgi:membrane-associated phospholipid phosphatase